SVRLAKLGARSRMSSGIGGVRVGLEGIHPGTGMLAARRLNRSALPLGGAVAGGGPVGEHGGGHVGHQRDRSVAEHPVRQGTEARGRAARLDVRPRPPPARDRGGHAEPGGDRPGGARDPAEEEPDAEADHRCAEQHRDRGVEAEPPLELGADRGGDEDGPGRAEQGDEEPQGALAQDDRVAALGVHGDARRRWARERPKYDPAAMPPRARQRRDIGTPIDRNLALELVRVTEGAAIAASRFMGRDLLDDAEQAAVDAMRRSLSYVDMDGVVVIGEGEKDDNPMLYSGETVGNGNPPMVDVAVDPIDSARLVAGGLPGALSAGLWAAMEQRTGIDVLWGIGGAPEGVLAACAVKAVGGGMQARLAPRDEGERAVMRAEGKDTAVLTLDDLCGGENVFFAATGVTEG